MTAQLAVLGLLVEQPLHGYAIERLIDERGMRNWTAIGFSSIYQVLDQLVTSGWAEVQVEAAPGRGKERRVHHVTTGGLRHWEAKALSALADVETDPGDFLMALSGLPFPDRAAVVDALRRRAEHLESRLADLNRDLMEVRPVPRHVEAMFAYTSSRVACEKDWVRSYLADLANPPEEQEHPE